MLIFVIILSILKLSYWLIRKVAYFWLLFYFFYLFFLFRFLLGHFFFLILFLGLFQFAFFRKLPIFSFHLFFSRICIYLFLFLFYFFFLRIDLRNFCKGSNFGFRLMIGQLFQFLGNNAGVDLSLLLIIWRFVLWITE